MNSNDKLTDFVTKSSGRPRILPLRMNVNPLIQAFANENLEPKELALVLSHYPVIVVRLLGLANSAWVKPDSPIIHIDSACACLGYATIKSVSLALAITPSFDTRRCPSFDPIRFWMTSMLVAEAGALLAARLANQDNTAEDIKSSVQTAGILHNLGLLWLADNMALETEQALKLTLENPLLTVNQALVECIGIDYCQVGAWLFKQWALPTELISAVAHHRDYQHLDTASTPALLVGAAASMVSALLRECNEISENNSLNNLGIEFSQQKSVFKQLADKLETTKALAKTLLV